jgi:hypothetical protein
VHVEAIGSGVVLIPRLDIELDAEGTIYDFITNALIKNGLLDPQKILCEFYLDGKLIDLDINPERFVLRGDVNLTMRTMNNLPGKREALHRVRQDGMYLSYEAIGLRADKDVVLAAVSENGKALKFAAEELRADKEVVLAALSKDRGALGSAAEGLRADRDVVLAAVKQNGEALEYAAEGLKNDPEVLAALRR